jgi:flagellar basal-body rod protein FlgG
MAAQQLNVDVISNNIANMNTTGFKRSRAEFQDLVYLNMQRSGGATSADGTLKPVGINIGLGVRAAGVSALYTQGNFQQTGNDLDLGIDGKGFFVINMPDGTQSYTRAGNFQRNAEGLIVTTDGYEVSPGITIPENTISVEVSPEGQVMAFQDGQAAPVELGQITLATFVNEVGLEEIGRNLVVETAASGAPVELTPGEIGAGIIRHGFVESSNVDIVSEITALITAQRSYEMNSKVVETSDQMLSTASNMR